MTEKRKPGRPRRPTTMREALAAALRRAALAALVDSAPPAPAPPRAPAPREPELDDEHDHDDDGAIECAVCRDRARAHEAPRPALDPFTAPFWRV